MHIVEIQRKMSEATDLSELKCCGNESYEQVILHVPKVHGIVPKDSKYYGIDSRTGTKKR